MYAAIWLGMSADGIHQAPHLFGLTMAMFAISVVLFPQAYAIALRTFYFMGYSVRCSSRSEWLDAYLIPSARWSSAPSTASGFTLVVIPLVPMWWERLPSTSSPRRLLRGSRSCSISLRPRILRLMRRARPKRRIMLRRRGCPRFCGWHANACRPGRMAGPARSSEGAWSIFRSCAWRRTARRASYVTRISSRRRRACTPTKPRGALSLKLLQAQGSARRGGRRNLARHGPEIPSLRHRSRQQRRLLRRTRCPCLTWARARNH